MPNKSYTVPITIEEGTSCWKWNGPTDAYGCPIASVKGKVVRVVYEQFQARWGYRPQRIEHTCKAKLCVNPDHMTDAMATRKAVLAQVQLLAIEPRLEFLEQTLRTLEDASDPEGKEVLEEFRKEYTNLLEQSREHKALIEKAKPREKPKDDTGKDTRV